MKILFNLLVLLTSCFSLFGQQNFGFEINAGVSKTSNNFADKTYFMPSGQIGLFYNLNYRGKSWLGAELLIDQVEGKDRLMVLATDLSGVPTGESTLMNMSKNITYLSLPIYYGLKINRLLVKLGVQTSFTIASSGRLKGDMSIGGVIYDYNQKIDKLYIDQFNFGALSGLSFSLTDKIAVEGRYYYGLNNLIKNSGSSDWRWKVHQLTVGVHYIFFTR